MGESEPGAGRRSPEDEPNLESSVDDQAFSDLLEQLGLAKVEQLRRIASESYASVFANVKDSSPANVLEIAVDYFRREVVEKNILELLRVERDLIYRFVEEATKMHAEQLWAE